MDDIKQSTDNLEAVAKSLEAEKKRKQSVAFTQTSCISLASQSLAHLTGQQTDAISIAEKLVDRMKSIKKGNHESVLLLSANALTLDALFHKLVGLALEASSLEVIEVSMNLAMRAQNQARKTVLALEQIKYPAHKTFVAQQNVAQIQQINTGLMRETNGGNISKSENKLDNLEGGLDETRALGGISETFTITKDARVEDLVPIHGSSDLGGQGDRQPECPEIRDVHS